MKNNLDNSLDNTGLPFNVKKALNDHAQSVDQQMSSRELENAWKSFSNLLDLDDRKSSLAKSKRKNFLNFALRPAALISFATSLSLAMLFVTYNYSASNHKQVTSAYYEDSFIATQLASNSKIANSDYLKTPDSTNRNANYQLPEGNHFSELVNFVKQDSNPVATYQKSILEKKLIEEIQNGIREDFDNPNTAFANNLDFPNSRARDVAGNSANLFYISDNK